MEILLKNTKTIAYFISSEKYLITTTTENNEGNPGANHDYGYDEHDNDKNDKKEDDD